MSSQSKNLQHLSKEDAIAIIQQEPEFVYIKLPENLRKDKDVAMEACKKMVEGFYLMPDEFKNNKDFCLELIASSSDTDVTPFFDKNGLSQALHHDHDIVVALLKRSPLSLSLLPKKLLSNKEIIKIATVGSCGTPNNLNFASKDLIEDLDFMLSLLKENLEIYDHLRNGFKKNSQVYELMFGTSVQRFYSMVVGSVSEKEDLKTIRPDIYDFIQSQHKPKEFYKEQFNKTVESYRFNESLAVTFEDFTNFRLAFEHLLSKMDTKDVSSIPHFEDLPAVNAAVETQRIRNMEKPLSAKKSSSRKMFGNKAIH